MRDFSGSPPPEEIKFPRLTWLPLFILGVGELAFLWANLGPAIEAERAGRPLPGGNSRPMYLVGNLLFLGLMGFLAWLALQQHFTRFTTDGIRQPYPFGSRYIRWQEITCAVNTGIRVHLYDGAGQRALCHCRDERVHIVEERVVVPLP